MLPKCFQRCGVSIISAVRAGDIGIGDGDLKQHRVSQTATLCFHVLAGLLCGPRFPSRRLHSRIDDYPVFQRRLGKKSCHPYHRRTLALALKSPHNLANLFAQLLFLATRSFASASQISSVDRGTLFGAHFRKSRTRKADPLAHAEERWSRLFPSHSL